MEERGEGGRGGEGVREADHQQKVRHATSPASAEPDVERNLTLRERMYLARRCMSDLSSVTWKPEDSASPWPISLGLRR